MRNEVLLTLTGSFEHAIREVRLYDRVGRMVKSVGEASKEVSGNTVRLDVSSLKSGVYYVVVAAADQVNVLDVVVIR